MYVCYSKKIIEWSMLVLDTLGTVGSNYQDKGVDMSSFRRHVVCCAMYICT